MHYFEQQLRRINAPVARERFFGLIYVYIYFILIDVHIMYSDKSISMENQYY